MGSTQAEIIHGHSRQLICSGQTATDADGNPQRAGDMHGQIIMALDNLDTVLAGAGMTLANVVRLGLYTTDVDEFMKHAEVVGVRLGAAGVGPPTTLLGVARLAFPELMIEIEATAAD